MIVALGAVLSLNLPASAQLIMKEPPPEAQGVELVSKLGEKVSMDLEFLNADGKTVKLGDYFKAGKPVILCLAYYKCPLTCPLVLERLQQGMNGLPYIVGEDFKCLVISFDPTETTKAAADAKVAYLGGYAKPVTPVVKSGWEFHVSPDSAARSLATSVGFNYKLIPETGQYSHPVSLVVLTPEGKVARYVSGLDYTPDDLRMALLEASQGKIASSIGDWARFTCFVYDDKHGRYTVSATRVMRIGGLLTALGVGTLIAGLRAGERLRALRREKGTEVHGAGAAPMVGGAGELGHAR